MEISKLMTTEEVAKRLRRSRGWVLSCHKRLGITSYRIGRRYLYPSDQLELWIQSQDDAHRAQESVSKEFTRASKIRIAPRAV